MAKKKTPGTKKKTPGKKKAPPSPTPTVTSIVPVFTIGAAVDFKVHGTNFFGTVTVAISEAANTAINWTLPTSSIVPDDSTTLTIVGAIPKPVDALKITSGAGEGDLTITVTSTDQKSTGTLTLPVSYSN
jgi:hypothetical protein